MKRVSLLTTLALACAFTACKKDNEKPKSDSDLLMAKTWTMTDETEQVGSAAAVSTFNTNYDACEKDNTLKFLAGNIVTMDEGALKCDPSDPQSLSGNWALSGKTLTFVVMGFGGQTNIDELTSSKLVLSQSETFGNVTTVTRTTYTGK